jgi:mRNA-degrading endonuclease RelE of RelBE toxin-antitoxin system
MPAFQFELTESAKEDLRQYTAAELKTIVSGLRVQLTDQSDVETANRKRLRENPVATWELRIGRFRAFDEIDQSEVRVTVVAVGHKEHNVLKIRGKVVLL